MLRGYSSHRVGSDVQLVNGTLAGVGDIDDSDRGQSEIVEDVLTFQPCGLFQAPSFDVVTP